MKKQAALYYLACIALAVTAVVVALGAYTRLVDAGLGCPDWPTCYGHLWVPSSDEDIARANQAFSHAPVDTAKTWPEQIHRIFAKNLGLLILVIFIVALRKKSARTPAASVSVLLGLLVVGTAARIGVGDMLDIPLLILAVAYFANLVRLWRADADIPGEDPVPFKLVALLAGLVILQGLFGMWTVTLYLWPQVVTAHLLGGFTILSLVWLLIQRSAGYRWQLPPEALAQTLSLRGLALAALVVVAVQIALGGWTTSNYAALACADFPRCHDQWWPRADFAQGFNVFQQVGPNYLGGLLDNHERTAIHLAHRLGALVTTVVMLWLALRLWLAGAAATRRWAVILLAVTALQVGLGISNVVFALPLAVAVAHNAGGALLLLVAVTINHRVRCLRAQS